MFLEEKQYTSSSIAVALTWLSNTIVGMKAPIIKWVVSSPNPKVLRKKTREREFILSIHCPFRPYRLTWHCIYIGRYGHMGVGTPHKWGMAVISSFPPDFLHSQVFLHLVVDWGNSLDLSWVAWKYHNISITSCLNNRRIRLSYTIQEQKQFYLNGQSFSKSSQKKTKSGWPYWLG